MFYFIDELKNYIEDNSEFIFGTNLFIGGIPEEKTMSISLIGLSPKPSYVIGNHLGYVEQNIQIRVKGNNLESDTRALAVIISTLLENIGEITITKYRIIKSIFETPMYQIEGLDAQKNFNYVGVLNVRFEINEEYASI